MPVATSRQIVRAGIAQFFGGSTYDNAARAYRGSGPLLGNGLSTVRAYQSKRVNDSDYVLGQAAGRGMGAYMIVELPADTERREALGGPTSGIKRIVYRTVLHVFHLAHKAYAEDAEQDVDLLAEAIKDLMHTDRTLGGAVFQAGETPFGIQTEIFQSDMSEEITGTYFTITFEADVHIVA